MKKQEVQSLYSSSYVNDYNGAFIDDPIFKGKTEAEEKVLAEIISIFGASSKWLDIACGTGYFLSRFPGTSRGGIDISKDMLARAERVNPGIQFLNGDMRDRGLIDCRSYNIISSMWWAYSYLDTIRQIKRFIKNVSQWLTPEGYFFLPIASIANLGCGVKGYPNNDFPYPLFNNLPTLGGELAITAVHWSWTEPNGSRHDHLLAPHPEVMRSLASQYFKSVSIIRYHEFGYIGMICAKKRADLSCFQALFPDVHPYEPTQPVM